MSHEDKLKILVVGAGAVGVFFSSKVAGAAEVSVVARSDYDALMRRGGTYDIISKDGDYTFRPAAIYKSIDDVPEKPDILICALKVLDGVDPVEICRPAIGENTSVVLIQNGLGNEPYFHEAFPENEIVGVVAYVGVRRKMPAVVEHFDGGTLTAGAYPATRKLSPKIVDLIQMLQTAGIPVTVEENIIRKRWYKLLWNVPFNTISVLGVSADTVEIMSDPFVVDLAEAVMEEVISIAEAEGYIIPRESIDQNISYTRTFAAYKTSMLQDYEAGRPVELEAILGAPLKAADKHAMEVPHMRTLYALLRLASRKHNK